MRTKNQQRTCTVWRSDCRRRLAITLAFIIGSTCFDTGAAPGSARDEREMDRRRLEARERRIEAENRKREFPLGYIPAGARERALARIQQADASGPTANGLFTPRWYNIGPTPIHGSPYAASGKASGRVTALAVNPANAGHWLLGAAQGGIWQTKNYGTNWSPRTDDQASLAMGAIAFSPSSPATVYAGTGEPNFRGDAYAGAGLLRSTDGGTTWSMRNSSFAQSSFSAVRVSSTDANRLSVATVRGGLGVTNAAAGNNTPPSAPPRGVHISANGGNNFTRVLTGEATDLQVHPGNFDRQYAALGEIYGASVNGVYRTLNGWSSSQLISGPWTSLATPTQIGRIQMAVSPSDPNTLYVGVSQRRNVYEAGLVGIWRTANAWATTPTWTLVPNPPVESEGDSSPRFWYHFYLLVDLANAGTLYLCEIDVWRYTAGGSWTEVGRGWPPPAHLHADNHVMAWVPGSGGARLLAGNDGGVWLSGPSVTAPWQDLNAGLGTIQFYKGAIDPTGESVLALGGTQDNGTPAYTGDTIWDHKTGGDGGDCAISASNPSQHWAVSSQGGTVSRTKNGGINFSSAGGGITGKLPFYTQFFVHFEKSPRNDDLFIAGTAQLWRCNNFFSATTPAWTANSPVLMHAGAPVPISAMAFAPSDASSLIYAFGTDVGQLRITFNGGGSWQDPDPANVVPNRYISGLAFSPTNSEILYVSLSGFDEGTPGQPGHLFKTENASAATPTWVEVGPPFFNMPLNCLAIGTNSPGTIYAGTDIGLWVSNDGGNSWGHHGPTYGMPNVAVFDLRINSKGGVVAFTHGRGAYLLGYEFNIPFLVWDRVCKICPDPVCLSCPYEFWADLIRPPEFELTLRNILPVDAFDVNVSIVPSRNVKPLNGTQNYGAIAGQGAAVSRTFVFEVNAEGSGFAFEPEGAALSCGDTIEVVFQMRDKTNDLGQITVPFRLGRPRYTLLGDFEQSRPPALPTGWISSGIAAWNTTTNPPPNTLPEGESEEFVSDEPRNITAFAPAERVGQTYLTSPSFAVASADAQLYFQQAFNLLNPRDGGILEIGIGTQSFQDILQAGGRFVDGGYNTPAGARPAWSGNSGGWVPVTVKLPPGAVGQQVRLRWHLATSLGLTNGFWFIDSVLVTEPFCPSRDLLIVNPVVQANRFSFGINTETNHTYTVECTTNLANLSWEFLRRIVGDGSLHTITVPATGSQRFYRFSRQ